MTQQYFLPSGEVEAERLAILHKLYFEPTIKFLLAAGLDDKQKANISIADVGCATGLMTQWLAEQTTGQVLALDLDPQQLAQAQAHLAKTPIQNVTFAPMDLTAAELMQPQVDLVYCRFVLHHLPDPKQGIQRLIDLAKPGGQIVFGECIKQGRWIYPQVAEFYEIYEILEHSLVDHHWDGDYGMKLLNDLSTFAEIEVEEVGFFQPLLRTEEVKRHHLLVLELLGQGFVEKGLIDQARLEHLFAKAHTIAEDPQYITSLFGLMLVRARKK